MQLRLFVDIWINCLLLFIVHCQQNNGNTASGNAMDLAMMNMNMMGQNSKCDIQPCQSVCQVLDKTSGCYVCSASCNTGTNLGTNLNAAPLNPQMPQMQLGMSGCASGWMDCPILCRVNSYRCQKCTCSASQETQQKSTRLPISSKSTEMSTKQQTEKISRGSENPSLTTLLMFSKVVTDTRTTSSSVLTTPKSSTNTILPKRASTQRRKVETPQFLVFTSIPVVIPSSQTQIEPRPNTSLSRVISSNSSNQGVVKSDSNGDSATLKGILVFVLTGLLLVAFTVSIMFAIVWRRSVRKSKRQKSELYFIHKAYRQDSRAKLRSNEFDMDEPVYARIDNKPEVPPRSPPTTPISPNAPLELFLRTESLTPNETNLKQIQETTHDYLELIS